MAKKTIQWPGSRTIDLPDDFPEIVCLIGSSRFKDKHLEVQGKLTLEGKIVLPMGMFGHHTPGFDMQGKVKQGLDQLHFKKIKLADSVFVVNEIVHCCKRCGNPSQTKEVGSPLYPPVILVETWCFHCKMQSETFTTPYIGDSSKREIAYAKSLKKKFYWLNEVKE